jgi:hypothetical protein
LMNIGSARSNAGITSFPIWIIGFMLEACGLTSRDR